MAYLERSITVDAPIEKVFSYIIDPLNEKDMNLGITKVRDITGKGVGQRWKWTYRMMGFLLKGEAEVIDLIPNNRYVTKTSGDISSTWTYTLKTKDNVTLMNLVIDYTISIPVFGKIGEWLLLRENERRADIGIANIKAKLEG
jgi:carbon monoxide dehydrogenase subunit G